MKTADEIKQLNIDFPDVYSINGYKSFYNRYIKRFLDFVFSIVILILLSPLFLIIAILIVADSGTPVFYRALRGGYKNVPFKIYKFRTMVKDADKIGGGTTALNDSRITRVGSFLRKTKLDEIANLINIVKGEMSFIGPRPELLQYTELYDEKEKYIFEVRPGITDFSSDLFINLDEIVGNENADEMYEKYVLKNKNALRVKYAAEVSLATDLKIFYKTVIDVIKKIFYFLLHKRW